MRPLALRLHGFRAARGKLAVTLPDVGLNLLLGRNLAEPTLGANGAGKTTLAEALTWAIYGKTTAGLSGTTLRSWGSKACYVGVRLLDREGKPRVIERRLGPERLSLDGGPASDADVLGVVGLTYEQWCAAVVLGQNAAWWLDRPPREQLRAIEAVVDLAVWDRARDRALAASKGMSERHAAALRDLAKAEGLVEGHQAAYARASAQLAAAPSPPTPEESDAATAALAQAEARLGAVKGELERIAEDVRTLRAASVKATADAETLRRAAADETDAADKAAAAAERLRAGVCPTCNRPWLGPEAKEHLETRLMPHEMRRVTAKSHAGQAEKLEAQATAAEAKLAKLDARAAKLHKSEAALRGERDLAKGARDDLARRAAAAAAYAALRSQLAATAAALESAKAAAASLATKRDRAAEYRDRALAAANAYPKVKLLRLDAVVEALAREANRWTDRLGLAGWRISGSVASEGAGGGTTYRLKLTVTPAGRKDAAPLAAFSGGEGRRLRLAAQFALADLTAAAAGLGPGSVEWWDEPTAHLDAAGVAALMDCLAERAKTRTVLLIEHRVPDYTFDRTLTVARSEDGLCVEG